MRAHISNLRPPTDALRIVFFPPHLAISRPIHPQFLIHRLCQSKHFTHLTSSRASATLPPLRFPYTPRTPSRTFGPKAAEQDSVSSSPSSSPPTTGPIINESISYPTIQLVDPVRNTLLPPQSLLSVLKRLNRDTDLLLQVDLLPSQTSFQDPTPICKILSKEAYRASLAAAAQAKKDIRRRVAGEKIVEISWSIEPRQGGDLSHRLERLGEFLREGRRVEVIIRKKRKGKGRVVGPGEAGELVARVETFVEGLKGKGTGTSTGMAKSKGKGKAKGGDTNGEEEPGDLEIKEWKAREGVVGEEYRIRWEGRVKTVKGKKRSEERDRADEEREREKAELDAQAGITTADAKSEEASQSSQSST